MSPDTATEIKRLCALGYQTADADYYGKIDELLATCAQTEEVQGLRRLAVAGPTLSSKRFAFPHIADRLHDA